MEHEAREAHQVVAQGQEHGQHGDGQQPPFFLAVVQQQAQQEEEDGNGAHVHGTGRKGLRAPVEREVLGNLGQVGLPGLLKKGVCL